ncbi:MAG: M48 family metallopeptidase [Thiobacillus sp.]|nr:M48 family metallopeptidase [Thiobacillus sp.]
MRLPNPEFNILLFGPGMPASGVSGRAHFEDGVLVLHGQGHWYTAPSTDIRLKMGGFDGRQWVVEWASPVGVFTAILQGDEAVRQFIAEAPEPVAHRLHAARKVHTKRGFNFRLALAAMVAVVFLPVFSLVWFWLNADSFSKWAADQVSLEQEVKLGEMALAQMRGGMEFLPEDAPADEVVERIGVRLTAGSKYPFHFYVVRDPRVNAFALPGGPVVVFTGLLEAAHGADEVAGVLAHEASHVERRHVLRNMIHALGLRAVMAVALGDFAGGIWGDMAGRLAELSYGRDLEREADLDGLDLLRKAGLPAEGMASFFEKMAAREDGSIELLSSHPASEERLRALREAIAARGPYLHLSLDVDWDAIKKSLQDNS